MKDKNKRFPATRMSCLLETLNNFWDSSTFVLSIVILIGWSLRVPLEYLALAVAFYVLIATR